MTRTAALQTDPMRTFEAERRRHLIEATIETVDKVGFKSASLSEIARRAGVSQGLFAHYFGDKDGLLEATLRFMASRLARSTAARIRAAKTPIDRVMAASEAALADEEFDRRTSAVWLAFWGQIMHSEPYRRVQSIYQRRMRSNLRHGLRGLVPDDRLETCVTLIAATIDGLWLQSHADPARGPDGSRARATVRALVDLLIAQSGTTGRANGALALATTPAPQCDDSAWGRLSGPERAEILRATAARLHEERKGLARIEARDTGRPVSDVEAHDIPLIVRWFERAAELAGWPTEERSGFASAGRGLVQRSAAGRTFVRAAGDAPLLSAARAAAPALAAGAPVVACAPAHKARALRRLGEILAEAGAPEAAFLALAGDEAERALRLADVAAGIRRSKSALIVMADADLSRAAASVARGPRRWARDRALGETLVFVAGSARERFVERLTPAIASLVVGDPLDPETEIGPLPSRERLDMALAQIEEARKAGARLWTGGRAHDAGKRSRAAFLKPTLLDRCREDMAVVRASSFAPVVTVISFETPEELAPRLKQLGAGLSLGAVGRDVSAIERLARDAEAATCRINETSGRFLAAREDWLDPWAPCAGRTVRIWEDGPGP